MVAPRNSPIDFNQLRPKRRPANIRRPRSRTKSLLRISSVYVWPALGLGNQPSPCEKLPDFGQIFGISPEGFRTLQRAGDLSPVLLLSPVPASSSLPPLLLLSSFLVSLQRRPTPYRITRSLPAAALGLWVSKDHHKSRGTRMASTCILSRASGARYAARVVLHYQHFVLLVASASPLPNKEQQRQQE